MKAQHLGCDMLNAPGSFPNFLIGLGHTFKTTLYRQLEPVK